MPLWGETLASVWLINALPGDMKPAITDVIDYAKAELSSSALPSRTRLVGVSPRNLHMQNGQVSLSRMSFYFDQPVTCRAQSLSQLNSFAGDE